VVFSGICLVGIILPVILKAVVPPVHHQVVVEAAVEAVLLSEDFNYFITLSIYS
jgi:hypothetical protein